MSLKQNDECFETRNEAAAEEKSRLGKKPKNNKRKTRKKKEK